MPDDQSIKVMSMRPMRPLPSLNGCKASNSTWANAVRINAGCASLPDVSEEAVEALVEFFGADRDVTNTTCAFVADVILFALELSR